MKSALLSLVLTFCFASVVFGVQPQGGRMLDDKFHHLGDSKRDFGPEVSDDAEAPHLEVKFTATKNAKSMTLALTCWDLNFPAVIEVNGRKADDLPAVEHRRVSYVNIPAGLLQDGENVIRVLPTSQTDDWVAGKLILYPEPFDDLMRLESIDLTVTDSKTGKPVPARVTITDLRGSRQPLFRASTNGTAVRTGLIYTRGSKTTFQLSEGDYLFYATRGMEWSRDKKTISVQRGKPVKADLAIRHEVDTRGFIAADTHIHTLTFSGHGDSSVEERMITLAGEGVELAISTDHNHQTDYRPYQEKLALNEFFTPVTGNEVTTKVGHFNGFPLPASDDIPEYKESDWVKIVDGIRAKGAKVVILNHPVWPPIPVFEKMDLNSFTGERGIETHFTFDGMELANSSTTVSNIHELFRDWFSLLNYGERITAVGSSDSHTVDTPVGQGRTYIRSSTDDPAKINVDEACENILAGDTSISLGIFADVVVEEKFEMGQLAPVKNRDVKVQLRVAAPSWVKLRKAVVFLNGASVAEQAIETEEGKSTDRLVYFSIPAPRHDAYLVCFVLGDAVTEPCWPTLQPYTMAASNPVYLDADHDGNYTHPRATAEKIVQNSGDDFEKIWSAVCDADEGTAIQILSQLYKSSDEKRKAALNERMARAAGSRKVFGEFLKSVQSKPAVGS